MECFFLIFSFNENKVKKKIAQIHMNFKTINSFLYLKIFSLSYRLLYRIKACIGMALGKIPVGNNKFISHLCVYTRLFFIRVCVQISFIFFLIILVSFSFILSFFLWKNINWVIVRSFSGFSLSYAFLSLSHHLLNNIKLS